MSFNHQADHHARIAHVREAIPRLLHTGDSHECILIHGSGTHALEAIFGTLTPASKVLVLSNGSRGRRIASICARLGISHTLREGSHTQELKLEGEIDPEFTHVAMVHHETGSGIINHIDSLINCGRMTIIDAVSAMGGIPANYSPFDFIAGASEKCFEAPSGCGVVLVKKPILASLHDEGNLPASLANDLKGHHSERFRFTPPQHVITALSAALKSLEAEGISKRFDRYASMAAFVAEEMSKIGFLPLIEYKTKKSIMMSFKDPVEDWWNFQTFHDTLASAGIDVHHGTESDTPSFRVKMIGQPTMDDMRIFVTAVNNVVRFMKKETASAFGKINPVELYDALLAGGVKKYIGVPDSLMVQFTNVILDRTPAADHIVAPNEGLAVSYAAGHYLATKQPVGVYLQNSGLGNAINPLLSLAHPGVYATPMILFVGWRGEPGTKDEPQHMIQGTATIPMILSMGLPYVRLTQAAPVESMQKAINLMNVRRTPVFVLISKDTLAPYPYKFDFDGPYKLLRTGIQRQILNTAKPTDLVFCTTGKSSRELNELCAEVGRNMDTVFLTVGSMGHVSTIALAVAQAQPGRKVWCLDGDGACLMHLGAMTTIGLARPSNLVHIIQNNGLHESVGTTRTAAHDLSLETVARAIGYPNAFTVTNSEELTQALAFASADNGLVFIDLRISGIPSGGKELSRPATTPQSRADAFTANLLPAKSE